MTHYYRYLAFFLGLTAAGCSAANKDQLINDGKTLMPPNAIRELFAQGPLLLESSDFDGVVTFKADGSLQAKTRSDASSVGKWKLADGNLVCLKFSSWYYGNEKCYQIIEDEPGKYVFFTANGARYYTARPEKAERDETAASQLEAQDKSEESSSSQDNSPAPGSSSNTESDIDSSFSQAAKNCPGCNLGGINLSNSNLAGANLAGADLSGTNLSGAFLRGANLEKANLTRANLARANLSGASLAGANFEDADLRGANLTRADLTGANLNRAITTGMVTQAAKGLRAKK